ncbi:MAG: HD family phosphohydrolase [Oscillochloridaceae bacterium umkhey_bin13]
MNLTRRRWLTGLPRLGPTSSAAELIRRRRLTLALQTMLLMIGIWASLTIRLPGQYSELEVGKPSPVGIWAPDEVAYVSEVLTAERQAQAENSPDNLVYVYDPVLPVQQRQSLVVLLDTITSIRDDPSLNRNQRLAILVALPNASVQLSDANADLILTLDDANWDQLRSQTLLLYDRAIERYDFAIDERALIQLRERWLSYWLATTNLTPTQREMAKLFTESFIRVNRALDEAATNQRREEARNTVPPQSVRVLAGENIVRAGEIVTPAMLEKLQRTGAMPTPLGWAGIAGRGLLAALLAAGFIAYAMIYETPVALKPRSLLVLILVMIVTLLVARISLPVVEDWPHFFPLAATAIILAVVFNGRLSIAAAALMATTVGVMLNGALPLAVTLFASSVVAVLVARSADRLLIFLLAGLVVAGVVAATQVAFWLIERPPGQSASLSATFLPMLLFAGVNGTLTTILALGLFNLISRAAGQVTPLQLMELAHPSRPLLRKLIREAPGTYYHSVAVGNLAEAAAEAVGADALLLRVAAYYHDIGKTIRPYFFTDNQMGRENVHNDLDPVTSAQIIIDHVREGVKMARAARLPPQIVDFIATHHGTGLIKHFYQQALQQEDSVREEDFRYPGPSPQTREQAILMLADSVEATVRSKAQNGKLAPARSEDGRSAGPAGTQSLEELVQAIIDLRVREGELSQSPLTMRELTQIKQAFVISLRSIYHPRVDYTPAMAR